TVLKRPAQTLTPDERGVHHFAKKRVLQIQDALVHQVRVMKRSLGDRTVSAEGGADEGAQEIELAGRSGRSETPHVEGEEIPRRQMEIHDGMGKLLEADIA